MPILRHFTAFVGVLRDEGIVPQSAKEAISTAHAVCAVCDDGLSLIDAVSAVSDTTGLEMEDAAVFVGASVASYCPEHEELIGA